MEAYLRSRPFEIVLGLMSDDSDTLCQLPSTLENV